MISIGSRLSYYLLKSSIYLISLLPGFILYSLSRGFAWLAFDVFKYRYKVIQKNLEIVFPNHSPEFKKKIHRGFTRNFSEILAETIKGFSMSASDFQRRFKILPSEEMITDIDNGKDIFIAGGHLYNWEWAVTAAGDQLPERVVGIYKPLSSKTMDRILLQQRERLHTKMIPMNQIARDIINKNTSPSTYLFLSDQSTPFLKSAHFVPFFNYRTPFVPGMSLLAHKMNIPIYYFYIKKIKRGYYQAHFERLTENSNQTDPFEITTEYSKKLSDNILGEPEGWLWSHKRWKRVLQY